ncbi:MAG TPA: 50S ribosomal protein L25 [Phycisphaerales bacterium]|nr:50S ribosomal protein L25 [Phycisphaerales bacterium]
MAHETPTLDVATRDRTGTRYARRLRESGRLPAVVYGLGGNTAHVSADEQTLIDTLTSGGHVLDVRIDGGDTETCLVKELQFGHLGDNLVHVDFTRVNLDQVVTVNVPITLLGTPKSASAEGAMLAVIRSEIEIRCKVRDIPSSITANISEMEEVLTIGELVLPSGVEVLLDPEKHICHIAFQAEEDEAEAEGEATEAIGDDSEPEVITEAKPEEESGEG